MGCCSGGFKTCTKCNERKPLTDFFKNSENKSDGRMSRCKVCKKAQAARWVDENRDRRNEKRRSADKKPERKAKAKAWAARPDVRERRNAIARQRASSRTPEKKEIVSAYLVAYRKANPRIRNVEKDKEYRYEYARRESSKERARDYARKRIETPRGNIDNRMSSSIWRAVRKNNRSWVSLVGYTLDQLMTHLEKQFTKGMGWHNFGEWHIDHIIPKSSFTYESADDPEFKECWSLSNLRPLWAWNNLSKGSKQIFLL